MWLSGIPYGDLVTESVHQSLLRASAAPTWYVSQAQKFSEHHAGLMTCHFEWALLGLDLDRWPTLTFREGFPGSALGPGFFLLLVSSWGCVGGSISCMSVTMDFIIMTSITSTWPLSSSWVQHLISGQPAFIIHLTSIILASGLILAARALYMVGFHSFVCTFGEGLLCARPCARHRVDGRCPWESTPRGDSCKPLDGKRACVRAAWGRGCRGGGGCGFHPGIAKKNLPGEAVCLFLVHHGWPVPEVVSGAQVISAETLPGWLTTRVLSPSSLVSLSSKLWSLGQHPWVSAWLGICPCTLWCSKNDDGGIGIALCLLMVCLFFFF